MSEYSAEIYSSLTEHLMERYRPMLPMTAESSDNPIVASVFDRLRQRWGAVLNLYRVLAWSPELVRAWAPFAWSLRFELNASRKLRELLIIRIADLMNAEYEYEHHLPMAIDEGITEEQIAALSNWRMSVAFDEAERAVLALADDLALKPGASPETMKNLQAIFAERDCVELLVTGSIYCGIAKIINSAEVKLEVGHTDMRPQQK